MLSCSATSDAAAQRARKQDSPQAEFGGTYDCLRPEQRRLVDGWFAGYNKRVRKNIAPESGYNAVPISIRTTFEAVTNALQTTSLKSFLPRWFRRASIAPASRDFVISTNARPSR